MTETSSTCIGVLGGMGPLAGAWFAKRLVDLNPVSRDQDHVPVVLVNDPHVPDRVGPILGEGPSPLPKMQEGIARLEAAGASVIVIACNTAHFWHDALASAARVPVLDMIDLAAREIAALATPAPCAVLATRGTLQSALYQKALARHAIAHVVPHDKVLAELVLPAIANVKAGRVVEASSDCHRISEALREAGAASLLIACTELSVCWPDDLRSATVDAGDALARAALRSAGAAI